MKNEQRRSEEGEHYMVVCVRVRERERVRERVREKLMDAEQTRSDSRRER